MAAGARVAATWLAHGQHGLAMLRMKIMAGQLGRKSGKGFYGYSK
jgi:3-hydroxyacyl-CoA dehydrogenase